MQNIVKYTYTAHFKISGFFIITIKMAQGFVLKEFILQTSPNYLREYCQLNNIPLTLPKTDNEDEVKEAVLEQLTNLDDESRSKLELDLQEINSLTPNAGLHMLIEEAKGKDLKIPYDEVENLNQHDKAFWFYLNQSDLFNEVATWYEVNDTRGWKELVGVKKTKDISKIANKAESLQKALSEYIFDTELRGKNCSVECYTQKDRICFVAYPEEYTESSIVYEKQKLRKRHPHKPVDKIFFLYYPKEGRLSTKAAGGWKRAKAIQKIFGKAVFGIDLDVDSDRVFNLDQLKDPEFAFPTPPEDKVEYVKLKQLDLRFFGGTRRLVLEVNEDIAGVVAVHDFIKYLRIPLSGVYISKATFQIKFETDIKRSRGTLTFFVAWPNSHNINDNPRYRKVKHYLKEWGLENEFEEILGALLSFDETKEVTTKELNRLFTAPITQWAIDNGIYKKVEPLKSVLCATCSDSHKIESRNGIFSFYCPVSGGREQISSLDIERWRLDSKKLLLYLADQLELTGKLRELEDMNAVFLGNTEVFGKKVPVYYSIEDSSVKTLDEQETSFVIVTPVSVKEISNGVLVSTSDLITLAKESVIVDKEFFDDVVTNKLQTVRFDENGNVWVGSNKLVQITPGTPQYYFFTFLWENFDNPVSHEDIFEFCMKKMMGEKAGEDDDWMEGYTPQSFCHKMKSLIKKNASNEVAQKLIAKMIKNSRTPKKENAYRLINPQ